MFPREYLINERRNDVAFLTQVLSLCETVTPEPEVIRELETVRAMSATLGRETDALAKSRAQVGAIETEIVRTRLEMELAKARLEAEGLREALETGGEMSSSVDEDEAQASPEGVAGGMVSVEALGVGDLSTAIDEASELLDGLQADARAETAALTKGAGSVGPIELLEYRQACRDAVKAAMNQALLDDLHDKDGNALVRMQVRATVLPATKRYRNTLGILRMELEPPAIVEGESAIARTTYWGWLDYVNGNINVLTEPSPGFPDGRILASSRLLMLKDYFDFRYLEVQRVGADGNPMDGWTCSGLRKAQRNPEACWYLHVALPRGSAVEFDLLVQEDGVLSEALRKAAEYVRRSEQDGAIRRGDGERSDCKSGLMDELVPNLPLDMTVARAADMANHVIAYWRGSLGVVLQAMADLSSENPGATGIEMAVQVGLGVESETVVEAAADLLAAISGCGIELPGGGVEPPARFVQALREASQRVAVYDVAPAERVQVVSTAARAVDALTLAANLGRSVPTSGLASRRGLEFARSAVGKLDALELAPIVVGFAEPAVLDTDRQGAGSKVGFGWLIGPRASIDPKAQALVFRHGVKPHDLYADLSIPGWWPSFTITAYTAWAPNWRDGGRQPNIMDVKDGAGYAVRTVTVPMRPGRGDMAGLTTVLLNKAGVPDLGTPRIAKVQPKTVSLCDGQVDFQIRGENVWRASLVHLGGRAVHGPVDAEEGSSDAIRVLPDMQGVVASVDLSRLALRQRTVGRLTVWTPEGRASAFVEFVGEVDNAGNCVTVGRRGSPEPSIEEIRPSRVSACSGLSTFNVLGSHLTSDAVVYVGGIRASDVRQWPSGRGLSFAVDVSKISELDGQGTRVSVSTQGGDASHDLRFADYRLRDGSCVGESSVLRPTIAKVVPGTLNVCASNASLTVEGGNLNEPIEARLGSVVAAKVEELEPKDGTLVRFEIDLDASRESLLGVTTTPAQIRTQYGMAFADVSLVASEIPCESDEVGGGKR